MKETYEPQRPRENLTGDPDATAISCPTFLRLAAVAGCAVGVGGGLGAALTACGEDVQTMTSSAAAA